MSGKLFNYKYVDQILTKIKELPAYVDSYTHCYTHIHTHDNIYLAIHTHTGDKRTPTYNERRR